MAAVKEKAPESSSYSDLFRKIEALSGEDKLKFCKTLTKDERQAYLDYLRDRDLTPVTGIFKCFEPVGGSLEMCARPWEGCDFKQVFQHGQEYTVPYAIAVQLEKNCWYPTHSHILDAQGKPVVTTGKKNFRFSFNTSEIR
jgi:hypothetical protein